MEEISVRSVSSKVYKKRKKRIQSGVIVKKHNSLKELKNKLFYFLVAVLFYLIAGSLTAALMNIKSLWYETLIKPPFMPDTNMFFAINALLAMSFMYIFYKTLLSKEKTKIISFVVNGVFYILLAYMFYCLKSPLGSLVIISVLLSQTIILMLGFVKQKKNFALIIMFMIIWQFYILFIVYTILMLN